MKKTMMQMDHTFTVDPRHRFLEKLKTLGFQEVSSKVEHPGGMHCRFLKFPERKGVRFQYLEFVYCTKIPHPYKIPGVSFRVASGLERYFRRIKGNRKLRASFTHRNYDWKANSQDRLPGWNFVEFKARPKECEIWITEYEPYEKRKRPKKLRHPNGAQAIVGMEFELSKKDWSFFEALMGVQLTERMRLPCGTLLLLRRSRRTRQRSVVVSMKDLDGLNRKKHFLELAAFDGAPALRIKNPHRGMWDLLLVQA